MARRSKETGRKRERHKTQRTKQKQDNRQGKNPKENKKGKIKTRINYTTENQTKLKTGGY